MKATRALLFATLLAATAAATAATSGHTLQVGESRVIRLERPLERVLVAQPRMATVKALTSRQLLVTGEDRGETELVLWYRGREQAEHRPLQVKADPARGEAQRRTIREVVDKVAPGDPIELTMDGGGVVLSGGVANRRRGQRLQQALEALDYSVANLLDPADLQQVQLFVRVAEVVKDNPLRSGAAFLDKRDRFGLLPPGSADSVNFLINLDQAMTEANVPTSHADAFQLAINPRNASLFGVLSLLESHHLARVLAQPTLVVESGESAKFLAGGEVPVPVAQRDDTITVEYKEFGVVLEFAPTVLEDGRIRLAIRPEVSNIDATAGVDLKGITIPGFRSRRTETTVTVGNGESFIVSGLMQDEVRSAVDQVPFLGDIPVLGTLFRSSAYENNRSELAVLVTPRLVRPFQEQGRPTLPGERISAAGTAEAILQGRLMEEADDPPFEDFPLANTGLEIP